MFFRCLPLVFVLTLLAVVGCQSTKTLTFQMTVKNATPTPCIIWLTKDGPPYEPGWKAPEEMTIEHPRDTGDAIGGVSVPPGKTASAGPIVGHFAPGTRAYLRVYRNANSFNELLAISPHSHDRTQILLNPGQNNLTIRPDGADVGIAPTR